MVLKTSVGSLYVLIHVDIILQSLNQRQFVSSRLQSLFPSKSLVILIILWALRLNISLRTPSSSHHKNICDPLDKFMPKSTTICRL